MFEGRVTEDEPEYIRLAVPELDGEIHVGHGVSCTLNQTLWYSIRRAWCEETLRGNGRVTRAG